MIKGPPYIRRQYCGVYAPFRNPQENLIRKGWEADPKQLHLDEPTVWYYCIGQLKLKAVISPNIFRSSDKLPPRMESVEPRERGSR